MSKKTDKQIIKRHLRYTFTDEERLELAKQLAEMAQKAQQVEADKKRVTSEFKAKAEAAASEVSSLSDKVASGYELRDIECEVTFNTPTKGRKTIRRTDSNELVEVLTMTTADLDQDLPGLDEDGGTKSDDKPLPFPKAK